MVPCRIRLIKSNLTEWSNGTAMTTHKTPLFETIELTTEQLREALKNGEVVFYSNNDYTHFLPTYQDKLIVVKDGEQ